MEEQDQDVTVIVFAVSGVIAAATGFVLGSRWRRRKMQEVLDDHMDKMLVIQNLQTELAQWMHENVNTMDHTEYLAKLREKAAYMRIVTEELC
jgi:hypothetical protein